MSFSKQSNSNRIVSILLSILLALCAHTAWSQAAPPFSITGSQQLSAQINGNTSPAVTVFNNQLLTLWCDQQTGNFSSSLQPTPTATPTQYNTGIVCLHSGNPVAASGIALTVDTTHNIVYAASELFGFCTGSCSPVLLTSTDGINWSSHIININDLVFFYGFGIAYFQGQLYFAYVGQNGLSVATSTDGVTFAYKSTVSTTYPVEVQSNWVQSPALYVWPTTGDLYIGYLTNGAYVVVGNTADGTNWNVQEYTTTILKRDLVLVPHGGALYFGGQSYYSENNLWMAGAYDGVSFPAATNYGGVMYTSPSGVDFGGTFYMVIRSGYTAHMWNFYAY